MKSRRAGKTARILLIPSYSRNPYQSQLARELESRGAQVETTQGKRWLWRFERWDVLHFHWIHDLCRPMLLYPAVIVMVLLQIVLVRATGGAVVWTIHNLVSHEGVARRREWFLGWVMARCASALIVHDESAATEAMRHFGADRSKLNVIPHGHYIEWYPNEMSKNEARQSLCLKGGSTVFLFFGQVRRYKGLRELLGAFQALEGQSANLVVAGEVLDESLDDFLEQQANLDPRIRYYPGYVPTEHVQAYMNSADAVVLPYSAALTSGALILAMSFGKSCIVPALEALRVGPSANGPGLVYDPAVSNGLASALEWALSHVDALQDRGRANLRYVEFHHNWKRVGDLTWKTYRTACRSV